MSNSALGLSDKVRNRDKSAGLAGAPRNETVREPRSRDVPDRHDEVNTAFVDDIDDTLEADPDWPASMVRLAAHLLAPDLLVRQIEGFRKTGFGPVAVSRLVNLHPEDIQQLCPHEPTRIEPIAPPRPASVNPRRNPGARRYTAAATARASATVKKRAAARTGAGAKKAK